LDSNLYILDKNNLSLMEDRIVYTQKLLELLEKRHEKDPGLFVNKSTISIELEISEEESFRYADYLVNNKWAEISEPDSSRWRIGVTDDGKKELIRIKKIILEAKEKQTNDGKKTNTESSLSKLQKQIEKEKLEAERRKAVVETKTLGAQIEIITALRNELKRRDENSKKIIELQTRLDNIESKIHSEKPISTMGYSDKNPEVQWYNEIMKYCKHALPEEVDPLPTDAKKYYSQIQVLRQEIAEISNSYNDFSPFHQAKLANILSNKRNELKYNLDKLSYLWTQI